MPLRFQSTSNIVNIKFFLLLCTFAHIFPLRGKRRSLNWIIISEILVVIIIIINTDHTIFLTFTFWENERRVIPVSSLFPWSRITWEGKWAVSLWKEDLIVSWRPSRDLLPLVNIWTGGVLTSLDLCPTVKDRATCCLWLGSQSCISTPGQPDC